MMLLGSLIFPLTFWSHKVPGLILATRKLLRYITSFSTNKVLCRSWKKNPIYPCRSIKLYHSFPNCLDSLLWLPHHSSNRVSSHIGPGSAFPLFCLISHTVIVEKVSRTRFSHPLPSTLTITLNKVCFPVKSSTLYNCSGANVHFTVRDISCMKHEWVTIPGSKNSESL